MQCPEKCAICPKTKNRDFYCDTRAKEWLKNIETIISKKREKGEGEAMAEEVIEYMQHSFMGGIYAK